MSQKSVVSSREWCIRLLFWIIGYAVGSLTTRLEEGTSGFPLTWSSASSSSSYAVIQTEDSTDNNDLTDMDPAPLPDRHYFDQAADLAYQKILDRVEQTQKVNQQRRSPPSTFNVTDWERERKNAGGGGLTTADRILLADVYSRAGSIVEFGLGESTMLAARVGGASRYVGVDSDAAWVARARDSVLTSSKTDGRDFRFVLADVGRTAAWGVPHAPLAKQTWTYQIAPLLSERRPFDVYLVDGRWRLGCLLASFLHASWASTDEDAASSHNNDTVVLLHDCERKGLHHADALFDVTGPPSPNGKLCQYRRRRGTTDAQIYEMWVRYHHVVHTWPHRPQYAKHLSSRGRR